MYAFFSESFQLLAGQVVEISDLIHLDDEVSAESSIKIDVSKKLKRFLLFIAILFLSYFFL